MTNLQYKLGSQWKSRGKITAWVYKGSRKLLLSIDKHAIDSVMTTTGTPNTCGVTFFSRGRVKIESFMGTNHFAILARFVVDSRRRTVTFLFFGNGGLGSLYDNFGILRSVVL